MGTSQVAYLGMYIGSLAAGCAVHRVGLLDAADGPTALRSLEGEEERLLLLGDALMLRDLDNYMVEIDGRKGLGRIEVTNWRILEGPHSLPVWVGPVQVLGLKVGIADSSSGMIVFVDSPAARAMMDSAGDWVAAEGYVEGPQQIRVLYWRPLGQDRPRAQSPVD